MAKQWKDLTKKQKQKFGGSKKAFKDAKKQVRKSGGNVGSVLQIKNAHKAAQNPSPPPPPPAAAPPPPAASFKQAVKDLGDDGKITNKDFKELVENYGEKKVTNNLEKVTDKNNIKIGNKPSAALGIDKPQTADKSTKKEEPKPSFKESVKELGEDGKIGKKDFKELVEDYGEKKVTNKLEKVADRNDIKIGPKPSKVLAISKPPTKESSKKPGAVSENSKAVQSPDINALRASVGLPPLSAEEVKKTKDKAAQDQAFGKHIGSIGKEEFDKRVKDAGGYSKYRELFDKGEHEPKKTSFEGKVRSQKNTKPADYQGSQRQWELDQAAKGRDRSSFKKVVKELAKDGKISNADYNDLKEQFGEKKVDNRLAKVADKNNIKIGNKPSKALGIDKQPAKTEPAKTEPAKTEPAKTELTFKETVKELAKDGKISNADYNDLKEQFGEKKVDNRLPKVAEKNDIKIGNKPSKALGIDKQPDKTEAVETEAVETDDKPSFKEAVKELGSDGKISNKDYKDLVDTYGEKKVGNKLEKVTDRNDIKIGNKPSEALGITKPDDTASSDDSKISFREAVKEYGKDGKISNKDYNDLVDEYGQEKVDKKLEKVADKKDIKIGNKPSEALGIEPEPDIYKDKGLNINDPEQADPPPKVKKTGPKAFQEKLDEYYEEGLEKYEGRMQKFAEDYNSNKGIKRYKGKKDESGRNKIQREYKDKRTADATAYDKDKSKFQKDKLNSLYAQRRDLLDDKGMVKRPSLDASTTPNPYEGAISEIKQALGIKKPNANYLKDQVKNSLTMKIDKPALSLNIAGAESARKFTAKQFTKPDYSYKPRT